MVVKLNNKWIFYKVVEKEGGDTSNTISNIHVWNLNVFFFVKIKSFNLKYPNFVNS